LVGSLGEVYSSSFGHNDQKVLAGDTKGNIRIWDVNSGKEETALLRHHNGSVLSAAYSSDGNRFISSSVDGTIKQSKMNDDDKWEIDESFCKDSSSGVFAGLRYSLDYNYIFAVNFLNLSAAILDASNGKEIVRLQGHADHVTTIAYFHDKSSNRCMVATGSRDKTIKVWTWDIGTKIVEEVMTLCGHEDIINCVNFSPDGQMLLTASDDKTAKLWNISRGEEIITLQGHAGSVESAIFFENAGSIHTITGSDDGYIKFWETVRGSCILTFYNDEGIYCLNLSSTRNLLLASGKNGLVRMWSLKPNMFAVADINYALENAVGRYYHSNDSEEISIKNKLFDNFQDDINTVVGGGRSILDIFIEKNDVDHLKWCAKVSPQSLMVKQKFAKYSHEECTALEYFIKEKETSLCKFISGVYNEMLLPASAIIKSKSLLDESMTANYTNNEGMPMCDRIDVEDLVLLTKAYPALILELVKSLIAVPQKKDKLVGTWLSPVHLFEVRGSSECFPRMKEDDYGKAVKFWDYSNHNSNLSLDKMVPIVVKPAILPLRNVASLEYDFLGSVFRAADGDPKTFESKFLAILIKFKWKIYIRRVFMIDFVLYSLMSMAFTVHAMWFITYSALPNSSTEKICGIILYATLWVMHLYFVRHEVQQAAAEKGTKVARFIKHFCDPWNLQDLIRLSFVSVALLYYLVILLDSENGHVNPFALRFVSMLSAFSIPLFALGFLFYLQAMRGYGALVRMVFKIIESIEAFLAVFVIIIFGYSASFNLLTVTDYSSVVVDDASWNTYANSLLSSTLLVMGVDVTIDAIIESHYGPVAVTLLVSFVFLMAVILLNLLIAIMSDKHGEVKKLEDASANYNRAGIIVEYEKLIGANHPFRNPSHAEYKTYSPTYLQVLLPESVTDADDSYQKIDALEQLIHDKTDGLRDVLDIQAKTTDKRSDELKEELKKENAELRTMLRSHIKSTDELKSMMTQLLLQGKDNGT